MNSLHLIYLGWFKPLMKALGFVFVSVSSMLCGDETQSIEDCFGLYTM